MWLHLTMLQKPQRAQILFQNIGKPFFLNFMTIEDEEWMRDRFPNGIENEMMSGNVNAVLEILWRLLDNDAKRAIRDAKIVKWEGLEEKVISFDDPIEKLKSIIGGGKDQEMTAIVKAIFDTREKSNPDIVATEKKSHPVDAP